VFLSPLGPPGTKLPLLGNEAIARGVLEAGIYVVTGYPGTPSSEVIMTLQEYARELDIYVEWAVNERVALEVAIGAAISGARAMATMKAPGLNVASDPLLSAAYSGVDGGLVIYVADDPGPHTTQTEQDSRWYAKLAKLPMISPSTPQEAKDYVKVAVELSEALQLPVILRTTTRVSHAVGDVVFGELQRPKKGGVFKKAPERFVRAGMDWNLARHKWLNAQLARVEGVAERYGLNRVYGEGEMCIVSEGAAFNYVYEAVVERGLRAKLVKLGLLYPLPRRFLLESLEGCKRVLVFEELDPYVEEGLKTILYDAELHIEVLGKSTGHVPLEGELDKGAALRALGLESPPQPLKAHSAPRRPPPLCPGCPHRFTFLALKRAISRRGYKLSEVPVIGDIGCYALGVYQPIDMLWTEHSMGASISMAMGLKLAGFDKPVVAVIGDSTFYHAGLQSLIEAVNKRVDVLVVIMDNEVVAMTGHQSTPAWSTSETGRELKPVSLDELVKAIGPSELHVVDSYNLDELERAFTELLDKPGVKVVISRHPCALLEARLKGVKVRFKVEEEKCTGCRACLLATGCPAIYMEGGKARIILEDCNGCGLCARFCPQKAIVVAG
jgi:indolepyruvate ferredoxin oxidoreductase alpha subunit